MLLAKGCGLIFHDCSDRSVISYSIIDRVTPGPGAPPKIK